MRIMGESSRYIAYIEVNENGMVRLYTKAFLELFSLSEEQMTEVPLFKLLGSEELRELMESHRKKTEGEQSEGLIPIVNKRKVMLWCMVEVITRDGYEVIYFHDRTESYQAQMILESAMMLDSDIFLFFDTRECVMQCSEEAVRIFGFSSRREAFGLHYTTFFHSRLQAGILPEMMEALEQGQRYEAEVTVRYKGRLDHYKIRAFNVMMKNKKAGFAVCLKQISEGELYVPKGEPSILSSSFSPYVIRTKEEIFEPFFKLDTYELKKKLHQAISAYRYNRSLDMLEFLLCYGIEKEKEKYEAVKEYLKAFCYEQAAEALETLL